jgi:PAS domain S-box-containing protein
MARPDPTAMTRPAGSRADPGPLDGSHDNESRDNVAPAATSGDQLLDVAPPMVLLDEHGGVVRTNRRFDELVDAIADSPPAGRLSATLVPPTMLAKTLSTGDPFEADETVDTVAGPVSLRVRCEPVRSPDGVTWIAVTLTDLNRERQAVERAAQVEERFYDIGRLISDWIWEVNADFEFTFVSPRLTEILGLPLRLIFGRDLFKFGEFEAGKGQTGAEPSPQMRTPFSDALYTVADINGQTNLFRMSGVPVFDNVSGDFIGYRGTGVDITRQLQTEEALSKNQALLQGIIDNTPTAICLKDLDSRYLLVNRQFETYCLKTYGLRENDIIGKTPRELFPPEIAELTISNDKKLLQTRELMQEEITLTMWDGPRSFLVSRFAIHGADGTPSAICVIESDITEFKEREAALAVAEKASREALTEAEVANRAKSEFLANISHELRTPLNAILGFSEVMKNELFGPLGSEQYCEYATDIFESGGHLLSLISDILDVSKIEAGKFELEEADVSLDEVIHACLRLVEARAAQGKVTLELKMAADLPHVFADARKLKQIILNLLSNAVKFTSEGGRVVVGIRIEPGGRLMIDIVDNGIGIAEADMEKVMEPFGQADSSLNRRFEGTGLGLPIARSYARAHGGDLTLDSTVGMGTTAHLWLASTRLRPQSEN